jgi:hypothetical protein
MSAAAAATLGGQIAIDVDQGSLDENAAAGTTTAAAPLCGPSATASSIGQNAAVSINADLPVGDQGNGTTAASTVSPACPGSSATSATATKGC